MSRTAKIVFLTFITLLGLILVSGLFVVVRNAIVPKPVEIPPVSVETVTAEVMPFYETYSYTGTIMSEQSTIVPAQVDSTVKKILVDEGESVKGGQLLAVLDDTQFLNEVAVARASYEMAKQALTSAGSARPEHIAQAEANYRSAKISAQNAQRNYERMKALFREGVTSRAQMETAEMQYESAMALLTSAEENLKIARTGARPEDKKSLQLAIDLALAQLRLAERRFSHTRIYAPYEGEISKRMVAVGDFVGLGQSVFEIVSSGNLKIEIYVPAEKIDLLEIGQTAEVAIDRLKEPIEATVDEVIESADPFTRLFKVRLSLPAMEELLPYDFAEVTLRWKLGDGAVVLPAVAILAPASEEPYVFIAENGKAKRIAVKLGLRNGERAQVVEPLKGGETVIVSGQHFLADGTPVRVTDTKLTGPGTGNVTTSSSE